MGDIIEFAISPSHGRTCFKITSSGLNFDVKTSGFATLGLSKKPGRRSDVLVTIGANNMTWIKKNNGVGTQIYTPDILNGERYSRFWLLWAGDVISLGRYGHIEPMIKYPSKTPKFMFITFLSYEGNYCVHWRVELPPLLIPPPAKPVTKGELHWVNVETQLPDDAFIGGFEREHLYIIRAKHRGSLTPGKFVPSEGCGFIAWGGEAQEKREIEVLCGYNCEWVATGEDRIPVGSVEAGYSEVRRELLYVGRVWHCGYLIPGKVQPSHKVCYIAYDGKEVASKNYEILTVRRPWPCVNKNILPNEDIHYSFAGLPDEGLIDLDDEDGPSSDYDL